MRGYKAIILILFIVFTLPLAGAFGEEQGEEEEVQSLTEEWREVLLYGIDEEIIEILKSIRAFKETSLNQELLTVLQESFNPDVKISILQYFLELKFTEAEDYTLLLLDGYDDERKELVFACIVYLKAIGSKESLDILLKIVDYEDKVISSAAILALGNIFKEDSRTEDISLKLLERLKDDAYENVLKPDILLALGELGEPIAVDDLIDIIKDKSQEKIWRMYAADALGKIGDEKAIPYLMDMFAESDALIRMYAATALAQFNIPEAVDILIQGLKDSNWNVRVASAKGLAQLKDEKALDILIYKAKNDPVSNVRIEAIKALGEIGLKEGLDTLRELYSDDLQLMEVREICIKVLVEKDLGDTIGTIEALTIKELEKSYNKQAILEITGKYIVNVESAELKTIFTLFLTSSNDNVRIYGIRGIVYNQFIDLKDEVEAIAEDDTSLGVRKSALSELENW
jgi:HEAT repeat protein